MLTVNFLLSNIFFVFCTSPIPGAIILSRSQGLCRIITSLLVVSLATS